MYVRIRVARKTKARLEALRQKAQRLSGRRISMAELLDRLVRKAEEDPSEVLAVLEQRNRRRSAARHGGGS